MRARINERFTQLHTERTAAEAKLAALTAEQPKAADPAILDEIPYAGDIIPALPPALKAACSPSPTSAHRRPRERWALDPAPYGRPNATQGHMPP
jgi:hypothetical protein